MTDTFLSGEGITAFRVIADGVATPSYVLPGTLSAGNEIATPQPSVHVTDEALRGTDGRVATTGVRGQGAGVGDDGAALAPAEQQPWGWGFAPAATPLPVDTALTLLPCDPDGFTQRQQDAVRRDLGAAISDMVSYVPAPFAGAKTSF